MEAEYVPAGEPPKVRNRKPRPRSDGDHGSQAVQGQQPPIRKSNRAPQPGAETWGYDEYGHADPAQSYGYGTGEHGYGSAHLDAAGQGYDYGHGYGYEGAQADVGQGYDYGYDHGYGGAQADAGYGHGYGYDSGQAGTGGQEYGYVAPAQHVQGNPKKSRKPRPEVQGDYANPEAYNAVDPSQHAVDPLQQKRESKPRRTKSLEKRNQVDNGEPGPEPGSARSRGSREGGSGSNRSSQRQDGIARDQHRSSARSSGGKSMTKPATEGSAGNALNEHLRKTGGGKPPVVQDVSMAVSFDPRDRTLMGPEARPSLDEWMKMQGNHHPVQQDESLIVFDDCHDKDELETRMFGAPLAKPNKQQQPPMKLPPLQEEQQQQQRPQYQPRVGGVAAPNLANVPADDKPLYRPGQRRGQQPSPVPQGAANFQAYNKPVYNNDDTNNMELKVSQPNAKCMACVHGVGVPIARLATRCACKHACLCTIL